LVAVWQQSVSYHLDTYNDRYRSRIFPDLRL